MPVLRGEEVIDLIEVRKNELGFTSPLQKNFAGTLAGEAILEQTRYAKFILSNVLGSFLRQEEMLLPNICHAFHPQNKQIHDLKQTQEVF